MKKTQALDENLRLSLINGMLGAGVPHHLSIALEHPTEEDRRLARRILVDEVYAVIELVEEQEVERSNALDASVLSGAAETVGKILALEDVNERRRELRSVPAVIAAITPRLLQSRNAEMTYAGAKLANVLAGKRPEQVGEEEAKAIHAILSEAAERTMAH